VLAELRRITAVKVNATKSVPLPVAIVALGWTRSALTIGDAVSVLLSEGLAEPAVVLQRALMERMAELQHLLAQPDPAFAATKVLVNQIFEFVTRGRRANVSAATIAEEEARLDQLRQQYPAAVKEVEDQRSHRRYHWSGLGLSALMETALKGRDFYSDLSWESHADLTPYRDVRPGASDGDLHSGYETASSRLVEIERTVADWILQIWNRFAALSGAEALPSSLLATA
jgi:hypothetical protein